MWKYLTDRSLWSEEPAPLPIPYKWQLLRELREREPTGLDVELIGASVTSWDDLAVLERLLYYPNRSVAAMALQDLFYINCITGIGSGIAWHLQTVSDELYDIAAIDILKKSVLQTMDGTALACLKRFETSREDCRVTLEELTQELGDELLRTIPTMNDTDRLDFMLRPLLGSARSELPVPRLLNLLRPFAMHPSAIAALRHKAKEGEFEERLIANEILLYHSKVTRSPEELPRPVDGNDIVSSFSVLNLSLCGYANTGDDAFLKMWRTNSYGIPQRILDVTLSCMTEGVCHFRAL